MRANGVRMSDALKTTGDEEGSERAAALAIGSRSTCGQGIVTPSVCILSHKSDAPRKSNARAVY